MRTVSSAPGSKGVIPRARARSGSGAQVDHLYSAVARLRCLGWRRHQQSILAHAHRLQPGRIDAVLAGDIIRHGSGTAVGQVLVVLARADRIRVALDAEPIAGEV